MTPLLFGLSITCVVGGAFLLVAGLVKTPRPGFSTRVSTPVWTRARKRWTSLSHKRRLHLGLSLAAGFGAFLVTGWLVLLVAVPVVAIGLPALLADPPNRDIEVLEALDRWVRAIAASLPTGKSITDAMRSTASQAPDILSRPLRVMLARLDSRWTTREALFALADDLDCPDADAVVAALVLAAERGGAGATATLEQLADSVQTRLCALREVEAERAKPRVVVRQVTVISLAVLSIAVTFEPDFFRPYRSPVGQVVLVALLAAYVVSLLAMRRMTLPRRRDRILARQDPPARTGAVRHG